jgi:hypothetical protein
MRDEISGQSCTDIIPQGMIFESNSQFKSNVPAASSFSEHVDDEWDEAEHVISLPATRSIRNFEQPWQFISKEEYDPAVIDSG